VLLIEPSISLLRAHIMKYDSNDDDERTIKRRAMIARSMLLLYGALLVALALGIYVGASSSVFVFPFLEVNQFLDVCFLIESDQAGTKFGNLNNTKNLNSVKTSRDANAIICLVVVVIVALLAIVVQFTERLVMSNTLFIVAVSAILASPFSLLLNKPRRLMLIFFSLT